MNTQFKDRTKDVSVPELSKFFKKGTKKKDMVWTVKNLGANEIAKANEALKNSQDLGSLLSSLASNNSSEKVDAIKQAMGLSDDVPGEVIRRMTLLTCGSVKPECSHELAVKLSTVHSTVFYRLTNEILSLTGEGSVGE